MIFKPVNEKHLEHLVSSDFFQKNCNLEYLGPVLLPNDNVADSPDMLLLDRRNKNTSYKTCECKFSPNSYKDFAHNGNFDIAILWECKIDIDKLKLDLFKQNKCKEVLVLSNLNVFSKLPNYHNLLNNNIINSFYIDKLKEKLKKGQEYTSFVAYIATKIYPKKFSSNAMYDLLIENFESVRSLGSKGKMNSVNALIQVIKKGDPERFLINQSKKSYKWNNKIIDSKLALTIITEIISNFFNGKFPSEEDIKRVEVK